MPLGYAATTNFAITLASLATAGSRESAGIDNTTNKYDDYMIQLTLGVVTPTTAGDKSIYIWFAGSADGTAYTEPATGADAAITIGTNHNLRGPFVVAVNVGTLNQDICIPSVAQYFSGNIPKRWNMIVENQTNGALSGTEFTKYLTGVFVTT